MGGAGWDVSAHNRLHRNNDTCGVGSGGVRCFCCRIFCRPTGPLVLKLGQLGWVGVGRGEVIPTQRRAALLDLRLYFYTELDALLLDHHSYFHSELDATLLDLHMSLRYAT